MERYGKIIIVFNNYFFSKSSILNLWEGSEYMSGFKWQGSEYALKCSYGRVLNIPGFQVCQISAYANVVEDSEYVRIWLNNALWQSSEYGQSTFLRVLNKLPLLNMPGLWILQGFEYARVTQGTEYAWICLNNTEYDWIWRHIPVCRICQNSECVWCST